MTLNGHFALKSLLAQSWDRDLMGWRILAFWQNCSEICRATHILSAAKM